MSLMLRKDVHLQRAIFRHKILIYLLAVCFIIHLSVTTTAINTAEERDSLNPPLPSIVDLKVGAHAVFMKTFLIGTFYTDI